MEKKRILFRPCATLKALRGWKVRKALTDRPVFHAPISLELSLLAFASVLAEFPHKRSRKCQAELFYLSKTILENVWQNLHMILPLIWMFLDIQCSIHWKKKLAEYGIAFFIDCNGQSFLSVKNAIFLSSNLLEQPIFSFSVVLCIFILIICA